VAPAPVAPVAAAPVAAAPAPAVPAPVAKASARAAPATAAPSVAPTNVTAAPPTGASTPEPTARAKETARAVEPPATPFETRGPESVLLSDSRSAAQKTFPIGYVIGGILVVLGIGGGIYGQRMRIRGRKPPGG